MAFSSRFLCGGFCFWFSLLLVHGGTEEFLKEAQEYREELNVVPEANLEVRWEKAEAGWYCVLGKGREKVATWDGSRSDEQVGKTEESRKDKRSEGGARSEAGEDCGEFFEVEFREADLFLLGESGFKAPEGWVWERKTRGSSNGKWLWVNRVRDVPVRQVHYVRSSPKEGLQPEHFRKNYPKPGDELRTTLPVLVGQNGERVEVDEKLVENPYSISEVHWRTKDKLWFEYIERGFGRFRLLELDAVSGETRVVAEESSDKFVHVYEKCGWWDLGGGKLLWRSEQDGWSHLYLVDEQSGERKQLTRGEWVVRGVNRVEGDEVFFEMGGFYPEQDPYLIHHARLNWKTGEMTMLTHGDGSHRLFWSPDRRFYVARYSRVDLPPVYELRRAEDGGLIAELLRSGEGKELEATLPERFVAKDREGRYEIHGVIWKPRNFDPKKTYPVVEAIYAGPHGAFVPKEWRGWHGHKNELAAAGFVVVQIDGRGTNFRGREFQQFAYKNLRDAGFPDRVKWLKEAARTRPWMDLERVGIYGGSAGGQSTLAALLWHGNFYKAGAADCGCHDNRMDKIWWNEQWMDWPVDESYAANSNAEHVSRLRGSLFLTVGEVDTNVDPSSTLQVVDALIRADKDFEFYLVPNGGHGIGESPYLRRKRVEFFQRSLGN